MGGEGVHPTLDFFEQVGDGLVVEGEGSTEEGIEDDPARPDVHFGPCVQIARDDLGGGVVGGAAGGAEEVAVFHDVAEAEIGELDVVVLGREGGREEGREGRLSENAPAQEIRRESKEWVGGREGGREGRRKGNEGGRENLPRPGADFPASSPDAQYDGSGNTPLPK